MLKPDYATAEKLAKNYSVIPVCREILETVPRLLQY